MAQGGVQGGAERGLRASVVEVATSLILAGIAGAAIWDSLRVGAGWTSDGPQSGYFPFWLGVIMVAASLGNLAIVARRRDTTLFVTWAQFRIVLSVLLPTVVYVAAIPFTGIYLASAALVAWFMLRLGGFTWRSAIPAGVATALVAFVVFELWFLVALPKGPLEDYLGY